MRHLVQKQSEMGGRGRSEDERRESLMYGQHKKQENFRETGLQRGGERKESVRKSLGHRKFLNGPKGERIGYQPKDSQQKVARMKSQRRLHV